MIGENSTLTRGGIYPAARAGFPPKKNFTTVTILRGQFLVMSDELLHLFPLSYLFALSCDLLKGVLHR